ncbi:SusC/RagA family TonB-linked outer membrane protein, partial [Hymenobacter defluvii]
VLVQGTTNGISTNADGTYVLTVPSTGGTLQFTAIGFVPVSRPIGSESQINVALAQDTRELSEVVVTGYGQQQERRDVTGAVTTVKAESFKDQPVTGVDQALQGRAAGVQVFQNSGTPGSGIAVRVRGSASISGSNEPLYVVDGLPINGGNTSQLGTGNQQVNALNDLNPNDIASIEVLKDAAAAAIYGSRASNGVVLITTKRGQSGKARVDVDYYTGAQTVWKKPNIITGTEQTQLFLDQMANRYPANADGTITTNPGNSTTAPTIYRSYADLAAYTFGPGDRVRTNGIYSYVDAGPVRPLSQFQDPSTATSTNWADQVLRTAAISNYGLNISGGSESNRYRLSLGYFDQKGTIVGSGYNRISARLTLDNKISDKVKMGASFGLSSATNNRINNDNSIYGALTTARLTAADLPIYNENGTYYKSGSIENPVAAVREPFIKSVSNRLIATQYTEFQFIKHLTYRATFGLDFLYGRDDRFYSTLTNPGAAVRGEATVATIQEPNFNHFSAFTYTNTFGTDHSLTALAVAEYQRDVQSTTFAQVTGFPSNAIQQLSAGATKTAATSSSTLNALFGVLAKVDYSFKGRYLLSATVRRDRSSRFGADNQVGYFPAASAGWRIIDESFLNDQQILSELKLRGSYGETGNQNFANFGSRGLISPGYNY